MHKLKQPANHLSGNPTNPIYRWTSLFVNFLFANYLVYNFRIAFNISFSVKLNLIIREYSFFAVQKQYREKTLYFE